MATPVSLQQLMLRVRQRANLEGASAFISDQELIDNINQSICSWWDLVRFATFQGQQGRAAFPFATVANQSLYALPGNCASIISVDANINGQSYAINAMGYQEEQRNMFKLLPFVGWSFGIQSVWYQIQGTNINFLPTPTADYNIVVNYIPSAPILNNPNQTLNSINGWEEWIVLDSAWKLLVKDGQTDIIPLILQMKQEQTDRINRAAAQMDMNSSEGVHETEAYGNWGGSGFGGYGGYG